MKNFNKNDFLNSYKMPKIITDHGVKTEEYFMRFFIEKNIKKRTCRSYYLGACDFFSWCHRKGISLEKIGEKDIEDYINNIIKDYTYSTMKLRITSIRSLFYFFYDHNIIKNNPASRINKPKKPIYRRRNNIFNPSEINNIFNKIPVYSLEDLKKRAILAVIISTGASYQSIFKIKVSDYYFKNGNKFIKTTNKKGESCEFIINNDLEKYLDEYLDPTIPKYHKDGLLFNAYAGSAGHYTS